MVKKLVKDLREAFTNSYAQRSTIAIVDFAVYLHNSLLLFVLQDPATCNIQRFGGFAETSVLISRTYLIIVDTIKRPRFPKANDQAAQKPKRLEKDLNPASWRMMQGKLNI
jgi:hypothetical protein